MGVKMRQEIADLKNDRPSTWSMACLRDATKVIRFMGFQAGIRTITWDGRDNRGDKLPKDIYSMQIGAGTLKATMKLVKLE